MLCSDSTKMTIVPTEALVESNGNISWAWASLMIQLLEVGTKEVSPAIVIISDFDESGPREIPAIRGAVDRALAKHGERSVDTVANTIFPNALWDPSAPDGAARLYERYERVWPRIQLDPANRKGVYFRRLTAFRPATGAGDPVNQLERMLDAYRKSRGRRSALQAGLFDPTADHRGEPFLGFPCLQQIAFAPTRNNGLSMTAFYAVQYQFAKAYGNYLGLCRLGRFVAHELGRHLTKMTCVASVATLGDTTKSSLAELQRDLRSAVPDHADQGGDS
ncbi:MAG: thymidylate synthase [Vicinamibacterales bacterium]